MLKKRYVIRQEKPRYFKPKNTKSTSYSDNVFVESFYLLFFGLLALLIVRVLILNHPVESTWDIVVLFLAASLYITLRFTFLGKLHEKEHEKKDGYNFKKAALKGFISTIGFILFMVLLGVWSISTVNDVMKTAVGGTVFFAISVLMPFVSYKIANKKK
ncbi:DUF6773 family protein [Natranaerofaba carboxydovora]|uniref:DUF6773 family protein n=1 Tax=Natranaerofaba carboxydovora TaxID=2742683 RepID=UPI001F12E347|nr:DUF6773 family protein [Natranaerofaba carboxydovora]UMZ74669.1 hypothetical protein ACONDI_02268 [Natranaerofaba carboxydovora]